MKVKLTKTEKKKWVAALRSGKYKQGQKALLKDDKFCCLGVACAIGLTIPNLKGMELASYDFLSEKVQNKLVRFNDGNDYRGIKQKSFNWIASYIERYL